MRLFARFSVLKYYCGKYAKPPSASEAVLSWGAYGLAKKSKGAVHWYLPGETKKPIAYSTIFASLFVVEMAKRHDTIRQIYDAISYDTEAKSVLRKYIDKGYGSVIARDIFE